MVYAADHLPRTVPNQMLACAGEAVPLSPWCPAVAKFQVFGRRVSFDPSHFDYVVSARLHVHCADQSSKKL